MLIRAQLTRRPRDRARHWRVRLGRSGFLLLLGATGCGGSLFVVGEGQPSSTARTRAEQFFASVGARFADPLRDQKYDSARIRIANAAFLPSRVWNDTSVWIAQTASRRMLYVNGHYADGRYRFEAAPSVKPTVRQADSHHVVNLTRLASGEFAWDTDVAYAVGTITAADLAAFIRGLIAGAEHRDEQALRADYRAAIPRTSAALGQLFSVDSIRVQALGDRSTEASFAVSIHPDGVQAQFPNFARYLRRYFETGRMQWAVTDRAGVPYMECSAVNGRLAFRVRTLAGALMPLSSAATDPPARAAALHSATELPLPDTLILAGSFSMKVRRFTVGFHAYRGELTLLSSDRERSMSLVTRHEPSWDLPLAAASLLRTPLRRPFQGAGTSFQLGIRDSTGGQTLLYRRLHLEVQESMILRFLGRLGAMAVSDFAGQVEREQSIWIHEVLMALVADIGAISYPTRELDSR